MTQIGNQLIVTTSNEGSIEKRLSNVSQNQLNMSKVNEIVRAPG